MSDLPIKPSKPTRGRGAVTNHPSRFLAAVVEPQSDDWGDGLDILEHWQACSNTRRSRSEQPHPRCRWPLRRAECLLAASRRPPHPTKYTLPCDTSRPSAGCRRALGAARTRAAHLSFGSRPDQRAHCASLRPPSQSSAALHRRHHRGARGSGGPRVASPGCPSRQWART